MKKLTLLFTLVVLFAGAVCAQIPDTPAVGVICEARHFCVMMPRRGETAFRRDDQRDAGRIPLAKEAPR
jgi:hypothetical protein